MHIADLNTALKIEGHCHNTMDAIDSTYVTDASRINNSFSNNQDSQRYQKIQAYKAHSD